jgi:hypothetical protein
MASSEVVSNANQLLAQAFSCASTNGAIRHQISIEVVLSEANYKVIASITGEANTKSFFGSFWR